jgi:hypothetical protein
MLSRATPAAPPELDLRTEIGLRGLPRLKAASCHRSDGMGKSPVPPLQVPSDTLISPATHCWGPQMFSGPDRGFDTYYLYLPTITPYLLVHRPRVLPACCPQLLQ